MKLIRLFFILTLICLGQAINAQRVGFIKGADGSVLDEVEQNGGLYYDNGNQTGALEIFKKYGFNLIRLKLWHTPENQFNSLPNVMVMAKRVKDAGLDFMLDIHYSDTWADPAHQTKPAVWDSLPFNILADSVYQYTRRVVTLLKEQGTLPSYIQIGNEISCGMLWNDGRICGQWANDEQWEKFGTLVKSGVQGVKDALTDDEDVSIVIHFDNGGNNMGAQWFFTNLLKQDVDFDIIGLSYYPWWHGTITELQENLNGLATSFQKDIMVVEAAYPWTLEWGDNTDNIIGSEDKLHPGYPATVEGQAIFIKDVMDVIKNTSEDRGKGYIYWSPEWIPGHPGSPWENLALFDFQGEVLESIKVFNDNTGIRNNRSGNNNLHIYPNPFGDEITVRFQLNGNEHVKLMAISNLGGIIDVFVDKTLASGTHEFTWNTRSLPTGIYCIVLISDSGTARTLASKLF